MILETIIRKKRYFNENSKKDVAMAKHFFEKHTWGHDGCPLVRVESCQFESSKFEVSNYIINLSSKIEMSIVRTLNFSTFF